MQLTRITCKRAYDGARKTGLAIVTIQQSRKCTKRESVGCTTYLVLKMKSFSFQCPAYNGCTKFVPKRVSSNAFNIYFFHNEILALTTLVWEVKITTAKGCYSAVLFM